MAGDTLSPLGLTLQLTGNNNDTWGDKLNANLVLLEKAAVGAVSVALSGDSGDLSDAQWVYQTLILSGTIDADFVLSVPDQLKTWFVINNTTNPDDFLTMTTNGSGEAAQIFSGLSIVYADGQGGVHAGNVGA